MIVELQIDSDAFCKSFREQMGKELACELTEDVFDLNPSDGVPGSPYIITGYTMGETKLRRAQNKTNVCIHTGAANITTFRQVNRPQLLQMVTVHISWVSDLVASNTAKAADLPLHLPVVFELGIDTCGNMRVLCFNYVGLDGVTEDALTQKLSQKIKGPCKWLPVEQILGEYMPKEATLVNSHFTLAQGGKCVAVRMEFWGDKWGADTGDPYRQVAEWEQFYTGHIADRLTRAGQRDGWSVFVDHQALTYFTRKTIADSMAGKSDLTVIRQPVATWHNWYLSPFLVANRVHVNMEVQQKDACWCLTEDTDVNADVDADVVITVPAEDTLRIDIYVEVSPDFWDASCCVATAALFWPIVGFGQHAQGKISAEKFFLGLVPFLALIGAIQKVDEAGKDFPPPGGFTKDPNDDFHCFREQKLSLPGDSIGKMTLKGAEPLSDPSGLKASGLYLYGGMETFVLPQPELENPDLEPFCWGKGGRCSRRVKATSRFRLNPKNPQHWALLQVCDPRNDVRVLDDPFKVFQVEVERELHGLPDVIVTVDFWGMNPDYWKPGNSYPCKLLVKTTGGVRILTLPPLPALTEEQFKSLYLGVQLEYVNNCYLPRHRLFEELEWPIEVLIEEPGLHNFQVRAVGMIPGERVQLVDDRGEVVARFTANRNGTLVVNALGAIRGQGPAVRSVANVPPSRSPSTTSTAGTPAPAPIFTLRRANGRAARSLLSGQPMQTLMHHHHGPLDIDIHPEGPLAGASTRPICGPDARGSADEMVKIKAIRFKDLIAEHQHGSRDVMIRQTLLEERGRIGLSGECLSLAFDRADGQTRLIVVMPGLVEAFTVSGAHTSRRSGAWRAEGVRGAVAFGARLLLWGEPGIWTAGDAPPVRTPFARCDASTVRGAVVVRDRLFVLGAGELRVFSQDLCERARCECRAGQIAAAGDHLALRDEEGLRILNASLREVSFHPLRGATHIETPAVPMGDAVYVRGPEGGVVITTNGEVLAEYEGSAWFEGVTRAGRLLAFPDGRSVRLVEAVRSMQSE